ncbi:MAG: hydantoinase B/oxoprolinase family protein, partial [Paracoccaceae bacterium]
AVGKLEIHNIHSGESRQEYSKFSGLRTEIGDVVSYFSPCGGGYGDPLDRDPAKVLDDVLDGFIPVEHARDDYGVVLSEVDDGYGWAVDPAATEKLRAELRA